MFTKTAPACLSAIIATSFALLSTIAYAENLIVNGNFELGATDFATDYVQDFPGTCCIPGEFAMIHNTMEVHSGYAAFLADHTTGTGQMIYIDSATTAGKLVWSQQVMVEQGKSYSLSAWFGLPSSIPDVLPPGDPGAPNVEFLVNGVSLGTFTTRNTNVWEPFSASWRSESSELVEITIISRSLNYAGNDFVLDDIVFELAPVAGYTTGLTGRSATCSNETTGQTITITLKGASTWDCEAQGLVVTPGDRIRTGISGVAK